MGLGAVLLPIILMLIAAIAYYSYQKNKRRREEMGLLAIELGCQFLPSKDYSHDDTFGHYEIFRRGHTGFAYNTLIGAFTIDRKTWPARMGDFHYAVTTSNGKSSSTHSYHFSYLILELPYLRVPDLLIRREGDVRQNEELVRLRRHRF